MDSDFEMLLWNTFWGPRENCGKIPAAQTVSQPGQRLLILLTSPGGISTI
jgi:hypothetical protein